MNKGAPIWKYFKKIANDKSECLTCGYVINLWKSNSVYPIRQLKPHLENRHPNEYKKYVVEQTKFQKNEKSQKGIFILLVTEYKNLPYVLF